MMPQPPPPNPNMMGRLPGFMQNQMMAMRRGMQPFPFPQQNSLPPSSSGSGAVHQPVEKPKVVYAAPPMKRVIAEAKELEKPKVVDVIEKPPEPKKSRVELAAKKVAVHGIELNVPVEEIEAEKKMNYVVPVVAPSTSVEATPAPSDSAKKKEKKKKFVRMAASSTWEDPTLGEWELGWSFLSSLVSFLIRFNCF